jgi:hypothetical protein
MAVGGRVVRRCLDIEEDRSMLLMVKSPGRLEETRFGVDGEVGMEVARGNAVPDLPTT